LSPNGCLTLFARACRLLRPGLLLLVLLLVSCTSSREKGMTPSSDWSRSVKIGDAVTGSVSMLVDASEENVHLAWLNSLDGKPGIRYTRLDAKANPLVEKQLDLNFAQLRMPRLAPAAEGNLHLLWARRDSARDNWGLWYARLDGQGELRSTPIQLSSPDVNIRDYTAAQGEAGGVVAAWTGSREGPIFGVGLDGSGSPHSAPIELVSKGSSPFLKAGPQGSLHMTWVDDGVFYYAELAPGILAPLAGTPVAQVPLSTGDSLSGPQLGLTQDRVYLLWSIQRQSGLEAGTARTEFLSFPLGNPTLVKPENVWVLPLEEQPAFPYQSAYQVTHLGPPVDPSLSTDFIHQPATAGGQGSELAAAVTIRQQYRQDSHIQVALLVFSEGSFKGYEMVSKGRTLAAEPVLAAGPSGSLYAVWRQGAGGRNLYFAATTPQIRAELGRLTTADVLNSLLTAGMEGFIGLLFFPILGLGWLLPGLLLVGLWKIRRDDDGLGHSRISVLFLVLALLLYQGVKLITLPSVTFYVPFSAWIEISRAYRPILQISVPLLILGLSFAAAEVGRRRRGDSAVIYYATFAGVDALLTLAIYGVVFLGVY
jgi:hypothetical protein